METAIWWIRRDLRLRDNQALTQARAEADCVIPVFILDPKIIESSRMGETRLAFLFEALRSLDGQLSTLGSSLILRQGDPVQELQLLCTQTGAEGIFAEEDVTPYSRARDATVVGMLPLKLYPGLTVHPWQALHKADGSPYSVFTPFSRLWRSLPISGSPLDPPENLSGLPQLSSLEIPFRPEYSSDDRFPADEITAQQRLSTFAEGPIYRYADERNRLDLESSSGLSPYLHFGLISARQAVFLAMEAEARAETAVGQRGVEAWINELVWREFYMAVLYHCPNVSRSAFREKLNRIPWRSDPEDFSAWCAGKTGYPVVDAAMRQLNTEGWMPNRARMITASFLTKDLLIDWREGERYFLQHLIDGDLAANNGGWQWVAGTGTDAAPYFRVFNPVLQGKVYDPHGVYVRRWIPELAEVPNSYIHSPWEMPIELQSRVGCRIGKDYSSPIADHDPARQRALAAYRQARD